MDLATPETRAGVRPPRVFYGWVVLFGCTVLSVLSGAFFYSRGIFLPEMAEGFGVGRLQISLAFTCAQVSGALSAPLIGRALDRYSPRIVLAAGAALLALGYVLSSSAQQLWLLYLLFGAMSGVGWVAISNFGTSRILVEWFRRRLGFTLAIDALGASMAGVVVAPLATFVIGLWGWRTAYASLGLATLAVALPVILFLLRARPADMGLKIDNGAGDADAGPAAAGPRPDPEWSIRRTLAHRGFWGLVLVFGLMNCVWSGLNLHLFGHMRGMGLTAEQAALVLSVEAAVAAFGKPIIGWISDGVGVRLAIIAVTAAQFLGTVAFAAGHGFAVALPSAAIYGLGLSGLVPLAAVAVADTFGTRSYGAASGLLRSATLPLILVSSPVAAYVYDVFGDYRPAFWCFAVLLLGVAPATLLLKFAKDAPAQGPGEH
ncbi:MFS transporter [Phenylobacterium sp.]|uniref:MFS transporter n=1 Tax=Phenylobacterium sp. TaxID=1871053 RepID=UPI0025CD96B2|nr:MFS transporter [Phenylobacterium sp.]